MNPLLLVLNPRRIPACINAIQTLPIRKAWLTAHTEPQLIPAIATLIEQTPNITHYIAISDDTTPTTTALTAVLDTLPHHPVVTGYCNLDATLPHINLSTLPPPPGPPTPGHYHFLTRTQLDTQPDPIPTYFAGMCLTAMTRTMWQRYPFTCYPQGNASDYHLSHRLHQDGIPIVAPKAAYVHHHKERWNLPDRNPTHQSLIGTIEPTITLEP